jgi:hypothetical protein
MVCIERTIGSEIVLDAPDRTPRMLKWKLVLVCLEIVLSLTQNRCTIYVKRTIGSEIGSDAPDGTPR